MRTLKFKAQPTNAFFATVNQMFGGSSQRPTTAERAVIKSNRWAQFRQHSRKLGGAAEHLIDGSEKCICRLSFEFQSPHVIEKRSERCLLSHNKKTANSFKKIQSNCVFTIHLWKRSFNEIESKNSTLTSIRYYRDLLTLKTSLPPKFVYQ